MTKKKRRLLEAKHTKTARPTGQPTMAVPDCKRFTGFKPCFPGSQCYRECVDPDPIGKRILIVNLDAMGNVLVTTSLLPALKRKYPESHISWITLRNAVPLLANNPYLDRVYVWEPEAWLVLQQMEFDLVLNADKSLRAGAFTMSLRTAEKLGFGVNGNGVIIPLNKEARENYLLGLDDELKFRKNRKSVGQILAETFGLKYERDRYVVNLSDEEASYCRSYRRKKEIPDDAVLVGFNTGCSELYPNKKMTIEQHVSLIGRLAGLPGIRLLLLGGPEDTMRNAEIAREVGSKALSTPTTEGVRRGLCYIELCDIVISGDSFGMHAAIGLGKKVIAWFGVTSAPEVDLFDRGVKLVPEGLECSPCWKRECPFSLECIEMIDLDRIVAEVDRYRRSD